MAEPREPIFRCFQDDLDDDDPRRNGPSLYCVDCRSMVWCEAPGEYMNAWLDTRIGPMCLDCFYARYKTDSLEAYRWHELDEWASDEWRERNRIYLENAAKRLEQKDIQE